MDEDDNIYGFSGSLSAGPVNFDVNPDENKISVPIYTIGENILRYNQYQISNSNIIPQVNKASLKEIKNLFHTFYLEKSIQLFSFLGSPYKTNDTLKKSIDLLVRIAHRQLPVGNTIKDLVLDVDCSGALLWVQERLGKFESMGVTDKFQNQMNEYMKMWKDIVYEMDTTENILMDHLRRFEVVQKNILALEKLPENEYLSDLVVKLNEYMKKEFENHQIEESYTNCINVYKKLEVLQNMMGYFRCITNDNLSPLCMVCFSEPVELAFVPCGHTYCFSCTQRTNERSFPCYTCRTPVERKQKIFFS